MLNLAPHPCFASFMNKEILSEALSKVNYPGFSRDIVSFGLVRELSFTDGVASVVMELTTGDPSIPARLKQDAEEALLAIRRMFRHMTKRL